MQLAYEADWQAANTLKVSERMEGELSVFGINYLQTGMSNTLSSSVTPHACEYFITGQHHEVHPSCLGVSPGSLNLGPACGRLLQLGGKCCHWDGHGILVLCLGGWGVLEAATGEELGG